uniref:Uncharacterized protein n=1 Tax=Stomoxys calcitrans TaxID=35570 RepID=A0A1I8NTW5_STOCA
MLNLIPIITLMYDHWYSFMSLEQYGILMKATNYLDICIMNWFIVMCYEIQRKFSQINSTQNPNKDFKRFIWYTIYVWSFSLILSAIEWASFTENMDYMVFVFFVILHTIIFLKVSFTICTIRLKASKMIERNHSMWANIRIIIRLSAIMGISQMSEYSVRIGCEYFGSTFKTYMQIASIVSSLNAVMIFILFVLRPKVLKLLKSSACCISLSKEHAPAVAV